MQFLNRSSSSEILLFREIFPMVNLDIDNPQLPLYLQPSDAPGNVMILVRLTGTENYFVWSRAMKISL